MHHARLNKRLLREASISERAETTIDSIRLNKNEKQLICAIFFWCEGGKDTGSGMHFINSDPVMVTTFMKLLRDSFEVNEDKFRAIVHLHDYHDEKKQLNFWSNITGIPINQFYNSYLKPHTGKQKKLDYQGCVSIRYMDRQFGLLLQMLYTSFGNKYRGVR